MDERIEDKSEESKKRHVKYYKSLSKVIENIRNEMKNETEQGVISHLENRIDAINLDKERIEKMFPDIKKEVEDE